MRQQIKRRADTGLHGWSGSVTPIQTKTQRAESFERQGFRPVMARHSLGKIVIDDKAGNSESFVPRRNGTGLPNRIKHGVEAFSGVSLDDVRAHYNSPTPANVAALAHAQGDDIYVGPGEETYLAHEAWHVVQQQQGRVGPTMEIAGIAVNDDSALEREADSMKALALRGEGILEQRQPTSQPTELSASKGDQTTELTAPRQLQRGIVQRTAIVQPGYASGDMFGIAAALILDPRLKVVITTENRDIKSDQTDVGEKIIWPYYSSFLPEDRLRLVRVSSIRNPNRQDNTLIDNSVRELEGLGANQEVADLKEGVAYGTLYIGRNWSGEPERNRNRIREAWDLNKSNGQPNTRKDRDIGKWLQKKGIEPKGKNVVILWSRFSGKKGDVHLEHDTSFTGMRQLITEALQSNDLVIIAGDKPIPKDDKPRRTTKYDEMANDFEGRVFNLTGFWEKAPSWCETRNDQFKLYDYLNRKADSVKHLGFRSGNLEALALIGQRVRYLEEPGSLGARRMERWHGQEIGYERITVNAVPTASGKYLKYLMRPYLDRRDRLPGNLVRPEWAPGRRPPEGQQKEQKPPAIGDYFRGFEREDLEEIGRYLNT